MTILLIGATEAAVGDIYVYALAPIADTDIITQLNVVDFVIDLRKVKEEKTIFMTTNTCKPNQIGNGVSKSGFEFCTWPACCAVYAKRLHPGPPLQTSNRSSEIYLEDVILQPHAPLKHTALHPAECHSGLDPLTHGAPHKP